MRDPTNGAFSTKPCSRCGQQLMRGPSGGIWHTAVEDAIACFKLNDHRDVP